MRVIVAGTLRFAGDEDMGAVIIKGGGDYITASRQEDGCAAYNWAVDPLDFWRDPCFREVGERTGAAAPLRTQLVQSDARSP